MRSTALAPLLARRDWPAPDDLAALARPRLATLGLIVVLLSYAIGRPEPAPVGRIVALVLGSTLALCGASALNQVLEVGPDALMKRTAGRPLPAGRVRRLDATVYGVVLSLVGLLVLWRFVSGLTAATAAAGLLTYVALYTPLKTRSSLSTVVGAIPGAVPVLMGWSAARGGFDLAAWSLFGMLFLWQLPHFLAIAWMYRADYARAGFCMLSVDDPDGDSTARQIALYGLALLPVSLIPTMVGLASPLYFWGALALGLFYLRAGLAMGRQRTGVAAKRLLKASVLYLPLLLGLLALDRIF